MKKLALIAALCFSNLSFAWISEEIGDHAATRCLAEDFLLKTTDGNLIEASATALDGKSIELSGELISLTINTDDASLYYKVILDDNPYGFRFLTIDNSESGTQVAVHYSISRVAGAVGTDVICVTDWKSDEQD
ncbi:MAG: hypothetical protein HRT45_18685 [Bdellovibrionales bacterium]|nr:hypothetical protein [Bdellovibrionales bacterium]